MARLNAIYLPAVLRFNEPAVGDKFKRVAQVMGLPEREANAAGVANAVAALNERLGIPKGLGAVGPGAGHGREDRRRRAGRPLPSVDAAPADQGAVHRTDRAIVGLT